MEWIQNFKNKFWHHVVDRTDKKVSYDPNKNHFWLIANQFRFNSHDWTTIFQIKWKKFNMKFAVFVFLSSLYVCFGVKESTWGDCPQYPGLRPHSTVDVVVESSFMKVKTHVFTFPKVKRLFTFEVFTVISHFDQRFVTQQHRLCFYE